MDWMIRYTDDAERDLRRLDRQTSRRIVDYMAQRVIASGNPRGRGHPMKWRRRGQWRYRVGDYRVLCDIHDKIVTVEVVAVDHRSRIYRRFR